MNEHVENLRRVAQNDYMIDQHFLPDGVALNDAADRIEALEARVAELEAALREEQAESLRQAEIARDALTKAERLREDIRVFVEEVTKRSSGVWTEADVRALRRLRAALAAEGREP